MSRGGTSASALYVWCGCDGFLILKLISDVTFCGQTAARRTEARHVRAASG